jgi:hypothetical protein
MPKPGESMFQAIPAILKAVSGGGGGGLLGGMNPMKMLKKLMDLPKKLMGGLMGGGGAGGGGGPLGFLQMLNPMNLLQGLGGAAKQRGL